MKLEMIAGAFAICKVDNLAQVNTRDDFFFLSRTDEELSLVCRESSIPGNCTDVDAGWSMLRVMGQLDFSLTGILAGLSKTLADAKIGIFAVSTYNTDYILIKADRMAEAKRALRQAGHTFEER